MWEIEPDSVRIEHGEEAVLPWRETAARKGIFPGLWQMQFLPLKICYVLMWLQFWERRKSTSLHLLSHPNPAVCDQNALKCVSPWGKQQRNRKLNYKILMKLQILIILRKQWKVQRVSRYYTMHCGSLCTAHEALEGLGCFVPGLWGGQTQQSCFMFPETTSGKSGEMSAGKARGLPRYSPEPHCLDSAGIGETCRNMCQLDFHNTGLADDQICVQQWRDTWFQSPMSSLCSLM